MAFKPAKFPSVKKIIEADVTTSRRKSTPTRITIRIGGKALKQIGINLKKPRDRMVSPFVDSEEGLIMLAFGDREATSGAKKWYEAGASLMIEYPLKDEFEGLFSEEFQSFPAHVVEASPGRLVIKPHK